jgi:hypothetical protein
MDDETEMFQQESVEVETMPMDLEADGTRQVLEPRARAHTHTHTTTHTHTQTDTHTQTHTNTHTHAHVLT